MKSFFTQLVLIAGLSVLAVSCGGSKGGGGGSSNNGVGYSNLSNVGLTQNGTQALAEANAWYIGVVEGNAVQNTAGRLIRTKYVANSSSNCVPKTFLGMTFQWCTSSSNTNQQGTEVYNQIVNLGSTAGQAINAKGNVELNNMFAGVSGTLIDGNVSGAIINLHFLRTDGIVVSYKIDRNYHSLLNPVIVTENLSSGRTDTVVTFQPGVY